MLRILEIAIPKLNSNNHFQPHNIRKSPGTFDRTNWGVNLPAGPLYRPSRPAIALRNQTTSFWDWVGIFCMHQRGFVDILKIVRLGSKFFDVKIMLQSLNVYCAMLQTWQTVYQTFIQSIRLLINHEQNIEIEPAIRLVGHYVKYATLAVLYKLK